MDDIRRSNPIEFPSYPWSCVHSVYITKSIFCPNIILCSEGEEDNEKILLDINLPAVYENKDALSWSKVMKMVFSSHFTGENLGNIVNCGSRIPGLSKRKRGKAWIDIGLTMIDTLFLKCYEVFNTLLYNYLTIGESQCN